MTNNIRAILEERGVGEQEFCLLHGFDQGHFNRIKNGTIAPALITAVKISRAFGVPVEEVFEVAR